MFITDSALIVLPTDILQFKLTKASLNNYVVAATSRRVPQKAEFAEQIQRCQIALLIPSIDVKSCKDNKQTINSSVFTLFITASALIVLPTDILQLKLN